MLLRSVSEGNAISKIKLYCTVFQKFSLAEIEKIIPSTRDFKKYYPYFQEVKTQSIQHSGCAFTLKEDADFNFITGFHVRINQGTEILLPPTVHVQLSQADAENFPGVAFEYAADGAAKKKNYYYITDPATKNQIAAEWNNPAIAKAEAIEYTDVLKRNFEPKRMLSWSQLVNGSWTSDPEQFINNYQFWAHVSSGAKGIQWYAPSTYSSRDYPLQFTEGQREAKQLNPIKNLCLYNETINNVTVVQAP